MRRSKVVNGVGEAGACTEEVNDKVRRWRMKTRSGWQQMQERGGHGTLAPSDCALGGRQAKAASRRWRL